jgi:pimeloyl-ACP methyl ester carboxylesterase
MPYVSNGRVRIHYQTEGAGSPLVLQHGLTQSIRSWHRAGYVSALNPLHRLILIDARGHGESDKPHDAAAYALAEHVGDVLAVLDALNLPTAHFWGYSMGGWIAFGVAKYAPDRFDALLIGGAQPYGQTLPPSRPDGSDPQAFLQALFGRLGLQNLDAMPADRRTELMANDFRALAAAQQDRPSLEDVLPTMTQPCFLYAGEADAICPRVQACAKQIANATFVPLPGLDHGGAFNEATTILPPAMSFLQGVARPRLIR